MVLTQVGLYSLQCLSQEEALLPVVMVGVTAVHILDPREAGFRPAVFLQGLEKGSSLSVGEEMRWWLDLNNTQVPTLGRPRPSQDQPARTAFTRSGNSALMLS